MNILVSGANGYVGVHLISYLTGKGHKVWAIVKNTCAAQDLDILNSLGAAYIHSDCDSEDARMMAPGPIDVLIHLLGSLQAPSVGSFRTLHQDKTRYLMEQCKRWNISKVVYLGTLGAAPNAPSEYLRTKWLAQEEVLRSGLRYVVLRSPLIFGKTIGIRESKVLARLKALIQKSKRIPILGNGANLLQPLFVGDLVQFLEKAATDTSLDGHIVDLGGPDRISFEGIVDMLCEQLSIKKPKVKIPLSIAYGLAAFLECTSSAPPITRDQVRMMRHDVVCTSDAMERLLGRPTMRFSQGA